MKEKETYSQESYGIRTAAYHVHQITIISMPFFSVQYAACVCDPSPTTTLPEYQVPSLKKKWQLYFVFLLFFTRASFCSF